MDYKEERLDAKGITKFTIPTATSPLHLYSILSEHPVGWEMGGWSYEITCSNIYLLKEQNTNITMVDTGNGVNTPHVLNRLEKVSAQEELDLRKLTRIIVTHEHLDHIGGIQYLLKTYGIQPEIMCSKHAVRFLAGEGPDYLYGGLPGFDEIIEKAGATYVPLSKNLITELEDQQEISIGGLNWKVIYTPGHSLGSICLNHPGWLISGDLLMASSNYGRTDILGADQNELIDSLKKLFDYDIEILLPGHSIGSSGLDSLAGAYFKLTGDGLFILNTLFKNDSAKAIQILKDMEKRQFIPHIKCLSPIQQQLLNYGFLSRTAQGRMVKHGPLGFLFYPSEGLGTSILEKE